MENACEYTIQFPCSFFQQRERKDGQTQKRAVSQTKARCCLVPPKFGSRLGAYASLPGTLALRLLSSCDQQATFISQARPPSYRPWQASFRTSTVSSVRFAYVSLFELQLILQFCSSYHHRCHCSGCEHLRCSRRLQSSHVR